MFDWAKDQYYTSWTAHNINVWLGKRSILYILDSTQYKCLVGQKIGVSEKQLKQLKLATRGHGKRSRGLVRTATEGDIEGQYNVDRE